MKGFTKLHPGVPAELRGTYAGLAHPASLEHLLGLGVTAVELLPVHHYVSEPHLLRRGLTNHWGYNTVGFFAPHAGYSASGSRGQQVVEFKQMVKDLHAAGLEVLLDVVYNHTGEGDELGPTLSWRGIDNAEHYRLDPHDPARYRDVTGCGSTFDVRSPAGARHRHGLAALLGHRDARRRLPLRPRPRAAARHRRRHGERHASWRWSTRTRCCRA